MRPDVLEPDSPKRDRRSFAEGFGNCRTEPAVDGRVLGRDRATGSSRRGGNEIHGERLDACHVDDLGVDTIIRQQFRRLQAHRRHQSGTE